MAWIFKRYATTAVQNFVFRRRKIIFLLMNGDKYNDVPNQGISRKQKFSGDLGISNTVWSEYLIDFIGIYDGLYLR